MKGGAMNNKMAVIVTIVMCSYLSGLWHSRCEAGSIWAKRGKNSKPVYSDAKACQIGDVLTIIIGETSNIKNEIDREVDNETSRAIGFDTDKYLNDAPFSWLPKIPGVTDTIAATSSRSLKAEADYEDKRTYTDKITVVVEDIHPNGNLVVLGARHRDVAGDKVTIQVSGVVRPRDIAFDNTIQSNQVANFKIVTINEGIAEDYAKPGWLASIFDALWPF
jgi:flagellar L-ring protein precursor FlgH